MPKKRAMNITFPTGGLDRKRAYGQQPPYTSQDMSNVRPTETIEKRGRGGSRPGLVSSHIAVLSDPIRMLYNMTFNPDDDKSSFLDNFNGSSLSDDWTMPSWVSALPSVNPVSMASSNLAAGNTAAVVKTLSITTAGSEKHTVDMFIIPYNGAFHGKYRLYLRMNNTTPVYTTDGVEVELTMTGTTGAYSATLKSYLAGVLTTVDTDSGTIPVAPGWLWVSVIANAIVVYWNNTLILSGTAGAQTGTRAGFGLQCTVAGGLNTIGAFRVQYKLSDGSASEIREMLIASDGDGHIWKENYFGDMAEVTSLLPSPLTLRNDVSISATQSGQKLYIADYGNVRATGDNGVVVGATLDSATYTDWTTRSISTYNDVVIISNSLGATVDGTYKILSVAAGAITLTSSPGDGTCSFRIERAPKVFDPVAITLSILTATAGQVPTGNPLICRYLDRIILAGADIAPQVWYASRQGTETDWDYSQTDSRRAVAGNVSSVGVPGSPITALAAASDDYLIIGCRNSIWRMRGDPGYGGSLTALSNTIGIIGRKAWCLGPNSELIFLSLDGIYVLPPGGNTYPVSMSRETLPRELLNINYDNNEILLEYDAPHRGVHIYITPNSSGTVTHWWMDWEGKAFWPMTLQDDHEPFAICQLHPVIDRDSGVVLGCRDGGLRRFSDTAGNDNGIAFTNYVAIGPLFLAPEGQLGVLESADAVMALGSGPVAWSARPAKTAESVAVALSAASGTWNEGLNATVHPRTRGQAYMLRITGQSGRRWALENIMTTIVSAGKRRIT